jgi:hypothetical protein
VTSAPRSLTHDPCIVVCVLDWIECRGRTSLRISRRSRRLESWRLSGAKQALRTIDDLVAWGLEPADDRARIEAIVESAKPREGEDSPSVQPLPSDRVLLKRLGLAVYYARVYRPGSDVIHYSIGSATYGFVEFPEPEIGGGRVALKHPDAERAEEALALAAITYGEFLERCDPVVRHGVTLEARQHLVAYLNAQGRAVS